MKADNNTFYLCLKTFLFSHSYPGGKGRGRERKRGEGEGKERDERGGWTPQIFRWIDAFGYDHSNRIPERI